MELRESRGKAAWIVEVVIEAPMSMDSLAPSGAVSYESLRQGSDREEPAGTVPMIEGGGVEPFPA